MHECSECRAVLCIDWPNRKRTRWHDAHVLHCVACCELLVRTAREAIEMLGTLSVMHASEIHQGWRRLLEGDLPYMGSLQVTNIVTGPITCSHGSAMSSQSNLDAQTRLDAANVVLYICRYHDVVV